MFQMRGNALVFAFMVGSAAALSLPVQQSLVRQPPDKDGPWHFITDYMTGKHIVSICKVDLLQFGRKITDMTPSHYSDGIVPVTDFPTIAPPTAFTKDARTKDAPLDGIWYFDNMYWFPRPYAGTNEGAIPCFFKFRFTQVGADITVFQVGSAESVTGKIVDGKVTFDMGVIAFEGIISEDEMSIHFTLSGPDEIDFAGHNDVGVVAIKDSPDFNVFSFQLCVQSTRKDVLRATKESLRRKSFSIVRKAMTAKIPIESTGCYAPLYNTGPMCDHCFDGATTQLFFKQDAIIPKRWSHVIAKNNKKDRCTDITELIGGFLRGGTPMSAAEKIDCEEDTHAFGIANSLMQKVQGNCLNLKNFKTEVCEDKVPIDNWDYPGADDGDLYARKNATASPDEVVEDAPDAEKQIDSVLDELE